MDHSRDDIRNAKFGDDIDYEQFLKVLADDFDNNFESLRLEAFEMDVRNRLRLGMRS